MALLPTFLANSSQRIINKRGIIVGATKEMDLLILFSIVLFFIILIILNHVRPCSFLIFSILIKVFELMPKYFDSQKTANYLPDIFSMKEKSNTLSLISSKSFPANSPENLPISVMAS